MCPWFLCRREKEKQGKARETCGLGGQDKVEEQKLFEKMYKNVKK
jgi:hypothetical protein